MKKRLLHIALMSFPLVVVGEAAAQGSADGIVCNNSVAPAPSAAATVVITGVVGKRVNICGWETSAGSTVSGTISIGWSSIAAICTTNVTTLTHAMDVNTVAWSRKDNPFAVISTPNSATLCVTPSSTGIKYMIFFSQD